MKRPTPQERFYARVPVEVGDACCEWEGALFSNGYGVFRLDGKNKRAHRIAWVFAFGPIPEGLCVLHRCDNPKCVRVDHLFLGTEADNAADMVAKNRQAKGELHGRHTKPSRTARFEHHGRARLSRSQVAEIRIRRACGESIKALAIEYSVGRTTIGHIVHRRTWSAIALGDQ